MEDIKEVSRIQELSEHVNDGLEALESLSKYNTLISKSKSQELSAESNHFMLIGLETIKSRLGYQEETKVAIESQSSVSKSIALETVAGMAKKVWDGLIAILKAIKAHFIKFFNWIKDKIFGVKKKAEDNKKETIDPKATVFTEKGKNFYKGTVTIDAEMKDGTTHHSTHEVIKESKEIDKVKHENRNNSTMSELDSDYIMFLKHSTVMMRIVSNGLLESNSNSLRLINDANNYVEESIKLAQVG